MKHRNVIINAGSSTIKLTLFEDGQVRRRWRYEKKGPNSFSKVIGKPSWGKAKKVSKTVFDQALKDAMKSMPKVDRIGFRYVHGGLEFHKPVEVNATVLKKLKVLDDLAPLHNPKARTILEQAMRHFPDTPKVLFFDTAFHASLAEKHWRYPLPKKLTRPDNIRRYGFHGLVCASIVSQFGRRLPYRLIVCHLGSGSSVTAIKKGKSIDTTMGYTPLEGTVMTTRAGDIDPGIVLHLLKKKRQTLPQLTETLNHQSGLMALAGTRDMRSILQRAENGESEARLAIDIFSLRAAQKILGCMASLGGLDHLVFSGGIGENAPVVREEICQMLKPFGIVLSRRRNRKAKAGKALQKPLSTIGISWMHADEEEEMNRQLGFLFS